jgi:two-component system, OmpR family, sensor kinase
MKPSGSEPTEFSSKKTRDPVSDACSFPNEAERPPDAGEDDFFRQVNIEFLIHELKDPVSVIEAGARLLVDKQSADSQLSPVQMRTLERILRNSRKTRDMLSELLEVGRAQSVCFHCHAFEPLACLKRILFEAIEAHDSELFDQMKSAGGPSDQLAFLATRGIRLDVADAAEHLTIEQDELKFSQIVSNLIRNGLSYRRRFLLIHLSVQRSDIRLSVRDDGPGIAQQHQESVFQRYKQVAPCAGLARGGHGLGLAVARILARSLGGDVVVESELGQGALFSFVLPTVFPS